MSKDVAARLDALTHDYREGRLSLAAYRNLRAPLLDLLISQPAVDGADPSVTTQRGRAGRRTSGDPHDARLPGRGLRVVGGLVVAAVVAIAAVTMYPRLNNVRAPVRLDTARETSKTLEAADDFSGARLHSMLAEFDGRAVCRKELAGSPQPFCRDLLATADVGPPLIVLTSSSGKPSANARRLFAISLHEVSQAQYQRYCAHTASSCRPQPRAQQDDAAANVTWDEAHQYLRWLSEMSGQTYRLPTEAESRQAAHDGKQSGWRAGGAREWTQNASQAGKRSKKDSKSDELRGFRAVRELQ